MRIPVKKLTLMAVLTAIALIVFIIEAQIPLPLPIPGAKPGLANTVTLFALFYVGKNDKSRETDNHRPASLMPSLKTVDAFMILACRIILGAVFTGRAVAFIYSMAGGLLGFAAQAALKRLVTKKQIWVCGAVGAVFHNIGQIIAAILVTGTPSIIAYLPVLTVVGVVTGILTGLIAQFSIERLAH